MNINIFRVGSLLLLAQIIFTGQFILVLYWIVLVASVEFLNTRKEYKQHSKSYTLAFFLYLLFITIVRTSGYKASTSITYAINVLEHLAFALVISFKISLYLRLIDWFKGNKDMRIYWMCVIAFNAVGFINEIYQNLAKQKPAFVFSFGARIDMLVNVVGSLLFVLIAFFYFKRTHLSEETSYQTEKIA